jgi:hypothetical protein
MAWHVTRLQEAGEMNWQARQPSLPAAVMRWCPIFCPFAGTPIVSLGFAPDRYTMVRDAHTRKRQPLRLVVCDVLGLVGHAGQARYGKQTSKASGVQTYHASFQAGSGHHLELLHSLSHIHTFQMFQGSPNSRRRCLGQGPCKHSSHFSMKIARPRWHLEPRGVKSSGIKGRWPRPSKGSRGAPAPRSPQPQQ